MDNQQADRMRVLWKSARDKYQSFFSCLEEVRQEVGDDELPKWCAENLRIGLQVIIKTKNLLLATDATAVARNLAAASIAEKVQLQKAREQATLERELAKHERAIKVAEAKIAAEQKKAEAEKAKAATDELAEKRKQKQTKPRQKRQKLVLADIGNANLVALAEAFKDAEAMCQSGVERWVEGSIVKALTLCTARAKFPADQDFGAWLDANEISIGDHDRAALIGLGRLGEEKLRKILTESESRSYQLVWRNNKPEFKVVE